MDEAIPANVGGYSLLRLRQQHDMGAWIDALVAGNPQLPDPCVIRAWHKFHAGQVGQDTLIHADFLEAARRCYPYSQKDCACCSTASKRWEQTAKLAQHHAGARRLHRVESWSAVYRPIVLGNCQVHSRIYYSESLKNRQFHSSFKTLRPHFQFPNRAKPLILLDPHSRLY